MGHGDELAIVDANFPAESMSQQLIRLDGVNATTALNAILTVLPLDTYVKSPATVMEVVGDPSASPLICQEFQEIIAAKHPQTKDLARIERFKFYDTARSAFAVVSTSETRLYGNILLRKGVIDRN